MTNRYRSPSVFAWVKRQGRPVRCREAAAEFGMSLTAMSQVLQLLEQRGAVRRQGRTHQAVWLVVNPRADVSSRSGLHVNSLRNLKYVMGSRRPRWVR